MQPEVNLLYQEKTEDHFTLDPTVFRWVLQCEIQREETCYCFSQSEHKRHWGREKLCT